MNTKLLFSALIASSLITFSSLAEDGHKHGSKENMDSHSKVDNHDHSKQTEDDDHNDKNKLKKKNGSHDDHEEHGHKEQSADDHHEKHEENDGDDHQEEAHEEDGEHGHGDSHEGGGKAIGVGKAIEDVDEIKGIKLSKEAIKTLSIKLNKVDGSQFKISKEALVTSKSMKGIYRFKNGYFKFMPAKIINENNDGYQVLVVGINFGDQIVVNGVGLLRVTDVYSTDKSEYGHSH